MAAGLSTPVAPAAPFAVASKDFKQEFDLYLAQCGNFPHIQPCRGDTSAMYVNVLDGWRAVFTEPNLARIKAELPLLNLEELHDLPRLAETLNFAAQTVQPTPNDASIRTAVSAANALRRTAFSYLEVAILKGAVKPEEYEPLRKGRGPMDMLEDLTIATALLTRAREQLAGKLEVPQEFLDRCKKTVEELRGKIVPTSIAKDAPKAKGNGAAEIRDRLYTLLVQRHKGLRLAGYLLWGDEFDDHVPSLLGRQRHVRRNGNGNGKSNGDGDGPNQISDDQGDMK